MFINIMTKLICFDRAICNYASIKGRNKTLYKRMRCTHLCILEKVEELNVLTYLRKTVLGVQEICIFDST